MIKHFGGENFQEQVKDGVTLVDFFATWCGPCKMLMPQIEALAGEKTDVDYLFVDIDQHRDLAATTFGITSVPTLILFKDGKEIDRRSGFAPKDDVRKWIEKHQ